MVSKKHKNIKQIFMLFFILVCCTSCKANNPIIYTDTIKVSISDTEYSPSIWTVNSGDNITLHLMNTGTKNHNWSIIGRPISTPFSDEDKQNIWFNASVNAGETKEIIFTSPNGPGEYKVLSIIDDHYEEGLIGKLIVIHADEVNSLLSESQE